MRYAVIVAALALSCGEGLAAGELSQAGTNYRIGLEALQAGKYDDAVKSLGEALRFVGQESKELKYRDAESRRKHSYYPHYELARARILQAKAEPRLEIQHDLLTKAINHLDLTSHPDAPARREETNATLMVVDKMLGLERNFGNIKSKVSVLCDTERFVEALRELGAIEKDYSTRSKEIDELRKLAKDRQKAVLQRMEQLLTQRLGEISIGDPTARTAEVLPLLVPVPATISEAPGSAFAWLLQFRALYEKETDTIRDSASLAADEVVRAAGVFETAAAEALAVDFHAGFRACRSIAHAMRAANLKHVSAGAEDVFDVKSAETVLTSAAAAFSRAEEGLRARPAAEETARIIDSDLASQRGQIEALRKQIDDGNKRRIRLTGPIVTSEEALRKPETVIDTEALKKLRNELGKLETDSDFNTMTARLRARAFFAHAVAEATEGFLQGNKYEQVLDRCRTPAWRAYGFDPGVDAPWRDRLSPKITKLFDEIKRQ